MVLIVCWFGTQCQTEKYAIALPRASVSFSIIQKRFADRVDDRMKQSEVLIG